MKLKSMLLSMLALGCACAFGGENKESAVAQKLQSCDFLLNKDFKKNAKYYLCLFSASWCGPCRREMPRIAKTYAEQLKADPDIELIHFSRDQNDEKALSWAKEHDVKFPVVKPQGGNPLELHSRGIPHLFIVKADGTLLSEGHPAKLFTDENLHLLKAGTFTKPETTTEKTRKALAKLFPGWSLDSEVTPDSPYRLGFRASHRGRANVLNVHPKGYAPVVLSRRVKLSEKNPCLFLCVSTWGEEDDILLSVRVNGQCALSDRLICTPNVSPWEELIIPLSTWQGNDAKIEVVVNVVGQNWNEYCLLSRLEIAEGKGDMRITEGAETVNGYTWSYRAQNGEATIIAEKDGKFSRAVSPCPIRQLTIPATLGGSKVTRIGRDAFVDSSAITDVTIPESVTRIGRDAFRDCTGLKSVTIPSSVKILDWGAFAGCNALPAVGLPDGLTAIDRGVFWWCCALTSIEIPSSVTYIGKEAFLCCKSLTSVTIPRSITSIEWQTFRGCNALTSMTIPASVTNIDMTAFCDTGALTSFRVEDGNRFYKSENGLLLTKDGKTLVRGVNGDVTIPSSVTTVGPCAFEGCWSLRPIAIPPGVRTIGQHAFKNCRWMESVTIPEGVTAIEDWAFESCRFADITIPSSVMKIGVGAFYRCALQSVLNPANLERIESHAFRECRELKTVTIPNSATSIGRETFEDCSSLTAVTIPPSVQRIEQSAFNRCEALTSLTIPSTVANIDRTAFDGCSKLKSVNVVKDGKTETVSFADFCKERNLGQQGRLLGRGAQRPGLLNRNRPRNQQAVPASCPQPRNAEMEEQRRKLQEIQAQLKALKAEQERMKAEKASVK